MLTAIVLAQSAPDGGQPPPILANPMFMFVVMGLILYFMIFLPQRRQRREQMAMMNALKKNDRVVTAGGILGTVVAMKEGEDEVTLRVDDTSNSRVRVLKSSIVRVTPSGDEKEADTKSG